MTLKIYLWGIGLASLLAMTSFLAILWFFPPENTQGIILFLLFFSLFLALFGFFSLVGFYLRHRRFKDGAPIYFLGISFREGTLLSILVVGFLMMNALHFFHWWSALIFLALVVGIEAIFLYKEYK